MKQITRLIETPCDTQLFSRKKLFLRYGIGRNSPGDRWREDKEYKFRLKKVFPLDLFFVFIAINIHPVYVKLRESDLADGTPFLLVALSIQS